MDEPIKRPGMVHICTIPEGTVITREALLALAAEFSRHGRISDTRGLHICHEFSPPPIFTIEIGDADLAE